MPWQQNLTFVLYTAIIWTFLNIYFLLLLISLSLSPWCHVHDPKISSVLWLEHLWQSECTFGPVCAECGCVCVCVCELSFSSCPLWSLAQSGVWGRRGCTTAYDWQPHYTTYTEPVREGEGRKGLNHITFECWSWICGQFQVNRILQTSYLISASLQWRERKKERRKWTQQHKVGIFKWQGMLIYWNGNCIQFSTMFLVWEDESHSNVKTHNLGLHFLAWVSNLGYTILFFFHLEVYYSDVWQLHGTKWIFGPLVVNKMHCTV